MPAFPGKSISACAQLSTAHVGSGDASYHRPHSRPGDAFHQQIACLITVKNLDYDVSMSFARLNKAVSTVPILGCRSPSGLSVSQARPQEPWALDSMSNRVQADNILKGHFRFNVKANNAGQKY